MVFNVSTRNSVLEILMENYTHVKGIPWTDNNNLQQKVDDMLKFYHMEMSHIEDLHVGNWTHNFPLLLYKFACMETLS